MHTNINMLGFTVHAGRCVLYNIKGKIYQKDTFFKTEYTSILKSEVTEND